MQNFNITKNFNTKDEKYLLFLSKLFNIFFLLVVWASLVLIGFSLVYNDVSVVGISMQPTINEQWTQEENYKQDIAYINTLEKAQRGDIIVANYNDDIYVIKRLIAIAGDTVEIKRNETTLEIEVFLTGRVLLEDYVVYKDGLELTLNNFNELKIMKPELFVGNVLTVPEGYIFYLGDNRGYSQDCAAIGPIEESELIGKVSIVVPYGKSFLEQMWEEFIAIF